jgi:hypothetical protein
LAHAGPLEFLEDPNRYEAGAIRLEPEMCGFAVVVDADTEVAVIATIGVSMLGGLDHPELILQSSGVSELNAHRPHVSISLRSA